MGSSHRLDQAALVIHFIRKRKINIRLRIFLFTVNIRLRILCVIHRLTMKSPSCSRSGMVPIAIAKSQDAKDKAKMAFTTPIKRPDDEELLAMVQEGIAPTEMAKTLACAANTVREWLRDLGCTHNGKGKWFLPGSAPEKPQTKPATEIQPGTPRKGVLREQFPFIRTHTTTLADGSRVTLPDLSTLAAARAEQSRRERHL
jgi:hypothetical protein